MFSSLYAGLSAEDWRWHDQAKGECIAMTQHSVSPELLAPDFYHYAPAPIAAVQAGNDTLLLSWPDGRQLSCHRFWLRENTIGHGGIDPATREGLDDQLKEWLGLGMGNMGHGTYLANF